MRKATVKKLFNKILSEIDNPDIKLLSRSQWDYKHPTVTLGNFMGRASISDKEISVAYQTYKYKTVKNTLWHEILHILHKTKPHWWIELAAGILSGHKEQGRYSRKYAKEHVKIGSRKWLIHICKKATVRINNEQLKLE
jgi:hypothetical protein